MKKTLRIISFLFLSVLLILSLFFLGLWKLLSHSYIPKELEPALQIHDTNPETLKQDATVSLFSLNLAHLSQSEGNILDSLSHAENETLVKSSPETTEFNTSDKINTLSDIGNEAYIFQSILSFAKNSEANLLLFQDIDRNSKRTQAFDALEYVKNNLTWTTHFAYDWYTSSLPYWKNSPFYKSKVKSGLLTLSQFASSSASRLALPPSLTDRNSPSLSQLVDQLWGTRPALLISRFPIENSSKELVIANINLDPSSALSESTLSLDFQNAALEALSSWAKTEYASGNYVVLGGSFASDASILLDAQRYNHLNSNISKLPEDAYVKRTEESFSQQLFWNSSSKSYESLPRLDLSSFMKENWTLAFDSHYPSFHLQTALSNEEETELSASKTSSRATEASSKGTSTWSISEGSHFASDGFILSPNLKLQDLKTLDTQFTYSNHSPILVSFQFN